MYRDRRFRELFVLLEPDGGFALDWQHADLAAIEEASDAHSMGHHSEGESFEEFQQRLYSIYLADAERAFLELGTAAIPETLSASLEYLHKVAAAFIRRLSQNPDLEALRDQVKAVPETEDLSGLLAEAPFLSGEEHLNAHWITCAWDRLNQAFAREMSSYKGSVGEFLLSRNPRLHFSGKVYFHLVESGREEAPFAFLATYAAEPSPTGKARHLPLKNALLEYGKDSKKLLELLSTVNRAALRSPFAAGLMESGELFHPIGLDAREAYTFLKEIPIYEEAGILCRIPNWWRKRMGAIRMSLNIGSGSPSRVGLDALVDFNVFLSLDGEPVTAEELKSLLSQTEGLALIKGKWVEVDRKRLQETLEAYEQAQKEARRGNMTLLEAMRLQLSADKILHGREASVEVEVTHGQWLEMVLSKLKRPESMAPVSCGENFRAVLREYQKKGLSWLHTMRELGLGACLADDMGLGKTVQVIALLNSLRIKREEKALVIVPASLIGNWTDEITRFAPGLRYCVLHPQEGTGGALYQPVEGCVHITTYGMLSRMEWLKNTDWDMVILDEAQAIKNPGTRQTQAVKQLKARCRIAMTGTPVENRLSDLWSLFDFLNKGLLGSAREFAELGKKLQESPDGYASLKRVVSPLILRRLKTDKSIIADLPDKIEMKTFSTLTKKQAALYSALVEELQRKLEASEGIERKGLVLASLMKFKQICNHPDQYLGQAGYSEAESGKYERLREICETVHDKRERVLVFTQFKELTAPLAAFLTTVFGHEGLVLHGETPVARRKVLVDRFQGHGYIPFMVLSIKAGGVGLNLTAANHVVHFDRWWNPAVENQATDRAFRIGQRKNVLVHKFITRGTVEEKIDRMMEDKSKLSREILPDMNESWITEMDNRQLMELFRLTI